jgi:catechol 2,3-dioxygenase-like lactoylglutathione lyase family enzyme
MLYWKPGTCVGALDALAAAERYRWASAIRSTELPLWVYSFRSVALVCGEYAMLTYVYVGTNDLERATRFYDATLAPLGMQRCITGDPEWDRISAGWGIYEDGGLRELGFWVGKPFNQQAATAGNGVMVAFKARSWKEVDDFHAAALAHGGSSEGAPGLRLHYSPNFYAAYVRDLDGNKLAAVCRGFTHRLGQES